MWETLSEKLRTEFPEAGIRRESRARAPWFTEYVRRDLISRYGEAAVYRGGMKVMTTVDLSYQGISDSIITSSLAVQNRISAGYNRSRLWKLEEKIVGRSLKESGQNFSKDQTMSTAVQFNREFIKSISDELEILALISPLPVIEKPLFSTY
jgi:penicillin-binding protein 1A